MTKDEKLTLTTEHCAVCFNCKPSMLMLTEIPCFPCCTIKRELLLLRQEQDQDEMVS